MGFELYRLLKTMGIECSIIAPGRIIKSQGRRAKTDARDALQILKLIIVRAFFSFLVKQDYLLKNPAASITLPKEEIKIARNILTEKEVFSLLSNMKLTKPISIRDRAIIERQKSFGVKKESSWKIEFCRLPHPYLLLILSSSHSLTNLQRSP